jgi:hypothetical protein
MYFVFFKVFLSNLNNVFLHLKLIVMKNLKTSFGLFFVLSVFFLTSCSKEQQALNKLEGKWTYSKATFFGFSIDLAQTGLSNASIEFNKCDSKQTQTCTGVMNLNGTTPQAFVYDMADDGKSVTVIQTLAGSTQVYKIIKLDKNNLVYSAPTIDTVIAGQPVKADVEFTCVR